MRPKQIFLNVVLGSICINRRCSRSPDTGTQFPDEFSLLPSETTKKHDMIIFPSEDTMTQAEAFERFNQQYLIEIEPGWDRDECPIVLIENEQSSTSSVQVIRKRHDAKSTNSRTNNSPRRIYSTRGIRNIKQVRRKP